MAKKSSVSQHSSSAPPLWRQLADRIGQGIQSGGLAVGERLPSLRECAADEGVSIATAIKAYRHLEGMGWVEMRAKSGVFVADWQAERPHRARLTRAPLDSTTAPVAYDKLVSLQHRMRELYTLTDQPLTAPLHLANADPSWYPCEALARISQRVMRRDVWAIGHYPTGTGLPAFKEQVSRHLCSFGLDLLPDDLLITNGSTEALNLALRVVTQPGDAVAVESPAYFGLLQALDGLGLQAVEIPCVPNQGMSLEALSFALAHQPRIRAVVASPHHQNPLGCTMPEATKRRLLQLVRQHDLTLIEDDVFGDLSHSGERPQPIKAWDRDGRVIYCGSCSKSLAPAFRLGWVAGGRHHAALQSLKLSQSLVTPLHEQAVLADYLASGAYPAHLRQLRARLAQHVSLALGAVKAQFPAGTQVSVPTGGWWLWVGLPGDVDTVALLRRAVAHGIAFTPGALFSARGLYGNHLRLNVGQPWARDVQQAIQTLAQRVFDMAHTSP